MSKTILIVDDSAALRQVVRLTLEKAGYAVTEAADGQEALERLDAARPDLIVCDLHMPGLDGVGLLRALQQRQAATVPPVVMLSQDTTPAHQQEAVALGARAWLGKPFRPLQLVKAAQRYCP